MRDEINIGPVPYDEDCAQLGTDNYEMLARAECKRFIGLLRKKLGSEPKGATLKVKGFPHDFGTYYEVVCVYEDTYPEAIDYAFRCEADAPTRWEED